MNIYLRNIFSIYEDLIYKLQDTQNFEVYKEILTYFSKSIYKHLNTLCEENMLVSQHMSFVNLILNKIQQNRHYIFALNIFDYCISILNIRIKYEKLNIYDTGCGSVMILQDKIYDGSLKQHMNTVYNKLIEDL